MPQVRKAAVDRRIRAAALQLFASDGYAGTSMAAIAAAAGVAPGNLYRYHPGGKEALFAAVVPPAVAARLEELVARRVEALSPPVGDHAVPGPEAEELLAYWTAHRLQVVILLDRAAGTPYEDYPRRFVHQLVDLALRQLRAQGAEPDPVELEVLELVFANTRSAVARILLRFDDEAAIRRAVTTFWSFQLPGLEGLRRTLVAAG